MTREIIDVDKIFKTLDAMIQNARATNASELFLLVRDWLILSLINNSGLRPSKVLLLDTVAFRPRLDESNNMLGFRAVIQGNGKIREILVDNKKLIGMLEEYFNEIRPHLAKNADPNELAMFLTQTGKRMSLGTLRARFLRILEVAGLNGMGITLHALRCGGLGYSLPYRGGTSVHGFHVPTTAYYVHIPEEFINKDLTDGKEI